MQCACIVPKVGWIGDGIRQFLFVAENHVVFSAARFLVEESGAMVVGADNLSFAAFPSEVEGNYVPLHTYLLAQTGTPISDIVTITLLVKGHNEEKICYLLGEGHYPCSVRTIYRILAEEGEVRERRNVLRHPQYAKPELLATGPNQLWSRDITKLKAPV